MTAALIDVLISLLRTELLWGSGVVPDPGGRPFRRPSLEERHRVDVSSPWRDHPSRRRLMVLRGRFTHGSQSTWMTRRWAPRVWWTCSTLDGAGSCQWSWATSWAMRRAMSSTSATDSVVECWIMAWRSSRRTGHPPSEARCATRISVSGHSAGSTHDLVRECSRPPSGMRSVPWVTVSAAM